MTSQPPSSENLSPLVFDLAHISLVSQSLREFADRALPVIAALAHSPSAVLYVCGPRLAPPQLFEYGAKIDAPIGLKGLCSADEPVANLPAGLTFHPLQSANSRIGALVTVTEPSATLPSDVVRLVTESVWRLIERASTERQLAHLNAYLTVSSMLAQPMGLQELLETILYCVIEVVKAEAASVLLLDEEKKNFTFYQVEGPAKPLLAAATFPSDKGIAGAVLQSQQSVIINDVLHDARFYRNIDSESGFVTRNMIAIPLTAGEEKIGVLEVINKMEGDFFSEDEDLLMRSIAEEIAFAIRNAKIFEYVVNSYCKQRQGQNSCKGCKRPLGSWTPCAKYREGNG